MTAGWASEDDRAADGEAVALEELHLLLLVVRADIHRENSNFGPKQDFCRQG